MRTRVGIGFGRIRRQSLRALIQRTPDVDVVAVNDLVDPAMNALLFKHDSSGRFDGFSLRVPSPTVSIVDLTADVARSTSVEALNAAFRAAEAGSMKGIPGVSDEPLVSIDLRGDSRSSIVDSSMTMVMGGTLIKVLAWYDNEWGFSCRVADLIGLIAARLPVAGRA